MAATLPTNLFRRYGVKLLALAALVFVVSLSLYAFGTTSSGMNRWETRSGGSHALWTVALLSVLLVAVAAASLRQRPQALRLLTGCAVITLPLLWWVGVIAIVSD